MQVCGTWERVVERRKEETALVSLTGLQPVGLAGLACHVLRTHIMENVGAGGLSNLSQGEPQSLDGKRG